VIETTVAGLGDVLDLDQVRRRFIGAREHDRVSSVVKATRASPSLADVMASIASSAMALWRSSTPLRTSTSRSSADNGTGATTWNAHQRRIDLEVRVLGRRADEHDLAVSVAGNKILLDLLNRWTSSMKSTCAGPVRRVDRVRA